MFKTNKEQYKLISVINQKDFCGEEKLPAVTCTFKGTFHNEVLDMFPGNLREKWFREKSEEDKDLADQGTDDRLTELNFDHVKTDTFELDYEADGYRMIIEYGISGDNDTILINCKLGKFKVTPKEGGIVEMKFNLHANVHQGTCEETAQLHYMLDEQVTLTLEPPSAEDRAQMEIDSAA